MGSSSSSWKPLLQTPLLPGSPRAARRRLVLSVFLLVLLCLLIMLAWHGNYASPHVVTVQLEGPAEVPFAPAGMSCAAWLEHRDIVEGLRNFSEQPVTIWEAGYEEWFKAPLDPSLWPECDISCNLLIPGSHPEPATADATTHRHNLGESDRWSAENKPIQNKGFSVLRNAESGANYPHLVVETAKSSGFDIVMTPSLDSDVPITYLQWDGCPWEIAGPGQKCEGFEIMRKPVAKTAGAQAAAFISNCVHGTVRLETLKKMMELGLSIHSYGQCDHNADLPDAAGFAQHSDRLTQWQQKMTAVSAYNFTLAFENSQYPDYVTEKFFQALAAGSVPVVLGAPNVGQFAPSPESYLQITGEGDIGSAVERLRYLSSNATAYAELLSWKVVGPSDAFKAVADLSAVHHTCRLCLHVADRIREEEQKSSSNLDRPCACRQQTSPKWAAKLGLGKPEFATFVHMYVRERGRFNFRSVVIPKDGLTLERLLESVEEVFKAAQHVPIWRLAREAGGVRVDTWRAYKIYRVGVNQKEALVGEGALDTQALLVLLEREPCPQLEVVFV